MMHRPLTGTTKAIALENRLKLCQNVITLGVRPNFRDYSFQERELIRRAGKIYYPSSLYVDLLGAMNIATFPSFRTYACAQDKIKQSTLFQLLDIPHPETRVFYGKRQKKKIRDYFNFPFVAKVARGSAMGRGVFLIRNPADLQAYLEVHHPAYIQEYLPAFRDIRAVVIGTQVVHAYWRSAPEGDFRTNVSGGGGIGLDPVPQEALELAQRTARACGWDDVGLDIGLYGGRCYVLEANMKYGKAGFHSAGIDYVKMMEKMIENGEI